MPAANQGGGFPVVFRIKSTALVQAVGAGDNRSLISKSPFGASNTPAELVLCEVNWLATFVAQRSVANTLRFAVEPRPLPPARSRPRPLTRIVPSVFTVAS